MILRTDLTSNTPEDKSENIRASIKRSAVKLGDFFARYMISALLVTRGELYLGLFLVKQLCSDTCLNHIIQVFFVSLKSTTIYYHKVSGKYEWCRSVGREELYCARFYTRS